MKRQLMRRLALSVGLLITLLVMAACGDSGTTTGGESPPDDSGTTAGTGEGVTLKFLTLDDPDQLLALQQMVVAWKASDSQYTNATVEIESVPFSQLFPKIEASVAAGADFDAFLADGPDIKHYAFNNAIVALADSYTQAELDEFAPQSIEEGSYNGVFYSPAIMQSCSMMFYNKDFTDAAGIQPPQAVQGFTMAEAEDAWQKTTEDTNGDGTPDVWGLRWGQGTWWGDYEHGIIRRSAGTDGSPTNDGVAPDAITFTGYLDTPESIASFEDYRRWHQGDSPVSPAEPIPDIFVGSQAAFMVTPDNRIGQINRLFPDGDFNYGVTGIPYYADGSQICHTGSWHFGVSPNSKQQAAAISLVKFFAGSEGARIWYDQVRQLPARFDLLNTLPEYAEYPQQLFADGLSSIGKPRIQTPCYTEYQQIFAELMQNVSQGQSVDVERLVKDAAGNMDQSCAKYEGWNQ